MAGAAIVEVSPCGDELFSGLPHPASSTATEASATALADFFPLCLQIDDDMGDGYREPFSSAFDDAASP